MGHYPRIVSVAISSLTAGIGIGWWFAINYDQFNQKPFQDSISNQNNSQPTSNLDTTIVVSDALGKFQSQKHPVAPWGYPISPLHIKTHKLFVNGYDRRFRIPVWGCHCIPFRSFSNGRNESTNRKKSKFKHDQTVPERFQARLADYKGSSYDRGHLVSASDIATIGSQQDLNETFALTNIIPQVGLGFNRDFWQDLEMFARKLSNEFDVYVVTGPLFIPHKDKTSGNWTMKYEFIGSNQQPNVAVPTHVFKVILVRDPESNEKHIATFVVPNQKIPKGTPFSKYLQPLSVVERWSGLVLFPDLAAENKVGSLCDQVACSVKYKSN